MPTIQGRYKAKLVAIELACRSSGLTQRQLGTLYGGISSQTVSLARKRAKDLALSETLARLQATIRERPAIAEGDPDGDQKLIPLKNNLVTAIAQGSRPTGPALVLVLAFPPVFEYEDEDEGRGRFTE